MGGQSSVDVELWTVASPGYIARHGMPRKPEDLACHEWIALSVLPSPWTYAYTMKSGRKVTVRMRGGISCGSASAVRDMVKAGLGLCAFPDSIIRT